MPSKCMAERLSSIRAHGCDGLEVHGQTERLPVKVLAFFDRHAGAVQQLEAALRLTPCMQWMTNEHLNELAGHLPIQDLSGSAMSNGSCRWAMVRRKSEAHAHDSMPSRLGSNPSSLGSSLWVQVRRTDPGARRVVPLARRAMQQHARRRSPASRGGGAQLQRYLRICGRENC